MRRVASLAGIVYAAAIYGFVFLPVAVLVTFSFQSGRLPVPPFDGPSLRWYGEVLADRDLMAALANSALVAVGSSAVAVVLGFLAAHALARHRLPGAAWQRALLVAPLTVSTLIVGLGLLMLAGELGISKGLLLVGVGHVVLNMPLCFAVIFAGMTEAQRSAERAARDLGAAEVAVLRLVTAPMLAPPILAAFFLSVTFSWDEFIVAFLLSRFDVTLPVEIWSLLRSGLTPETNAIGSIVFLVSIGLVVLLELTVFRRVGRT